MHEEIKNDSLDDIAKTALNNMLEQWKSEGLSDMEILYKLNEPVLQGLYEHVMKCFAITQTMYTIAVESAEEFSKYVSDNVNNEKKKEKQYTMLVLQHIHGRACQEFLEILHMLRLGFADGAYARWRSMYELCCNAKFIVTYGEQIAQRYYEQSESEDHKYTWAAGVTCNNGKKLGARPKFNDIQDNCDIDGAWKKQYKLACLVNHGSPQGTFKRLANGPGSNCIPVGHSNYGIAMPAIQSAISLLWISHLFFTLFPTAEYVSRVMLMKDWLDFLHEEYAETEKRLFGDLEKSENPKIDPI